MKNNGQTSPTGPLTIYVAWHPNSPDGAYLAKEIYDWFRKPSMVVERSGAGIPVYYRSRPWRPLGADPSVEPRLLPIDFEHAQINVVIPLVDEHMVSDVQWRRWLYEHGEHHKQGQSDHGSPAGRVLLIPVELHRSLARLNPIVSNINPVRVDQWDDDDQGADATVADERRRDRRGRRLRRHLVQTLVRELRRRRSDGAGDLLPRSVFLSHAKRDLESGVGVVDRIRVEALKHGQIDTFFDATELDWGAHWRGPMLTAAGGRTAAFIAVFGDLYASRHWCREEMRRARRPRLIGEAEKPEPSRQVPADLADRIWWVQPMAIIDTLGQQWTRLLPEMSGAPIIRWQDGTDSIAEILDRVMLEALRSEIQARHAQLLAERIKGVLTRRPDGSSTWNVEKIHFLTWVPDPYTLLEWAYPSKDEKENDPSAKPIDDAIVVYPGHGLAQSDDQSIHHYLGDGIRFMSVEEVLMKLRNAESSGVSDRVAPAQRPLVALSAGNPDTEELHALGYGPEHLDDAVYRLATSLITASARLAYGGALLRQDTDDFLGSVLNAASMTQWQDPDRKAPPDPEPETVLHSYQAWYYYEATDADTRAGHHGLCTFHDIDPEGLPERSARAGFSEGERALWRARALTTMRLAVARDAQAMIGLGGKIYGWSGMAPGVLEEICLMHEAGRQPLVLAAFGGASRALVQWLLGGSDTFDLLTFEHHEANGRNAPFQRMLTGLYDEMGESEGKEWMRGFYGRLHDMAQDLRATLGSVGNHKTYAGLTAVELNQLMTTSSVSTIRHLLTHRVVPHLLDQDPSA